jgi:hypothetical protein
MDECFGLVPRVPWHVVPLLGSDRQTGKCTIEEWGFLRGLVGNNSTAIEERCFLCIPCQDVISKTTGAISRCSISQVTNSNPVYSHCRKFS